MSGVRRWKAFVWCVHAYIFGGGDTAVQQCEKGSIEVASFLDYFKVAHRKVGKHDTRVLSS